MTPYHSQHNVTIYCDDCVTAMQNMEDNSIDAIVTDPPYGLSKQPDIVEVLTHWLNGDDYEHTGGGFMGRAWDSFVPGPSVWRECLRVLKPGGHLLAFAGTRTVDLMGISLRLGGFEIRDMVAWVTGQGFPKSLDIGKAIDKIDAMGMRRERQLKFTKWMRSTGLTASQIDKVTNSFMGSHYTTHLTQPAIPTRDYFEKLRSHIKIEVPDWVERLIDERTVESENFKRRDVIGTKEKLDSYQFKGNNVYQTGGNKGYVDIIITAPATPEAQQWEGFGTGLKPAIEPVLLCRKPISEKNIAANVLRWGVGGINIDGCRVRTDETIETGRNGRNSLTWKQTSELNDKERAFQNNGRFPANLILSDDDEVRELFPEARSSGNVKPTSGGHFTVGSKAEATRIVYPNGNPYRDSGSAARFFKSFPQNENDNLLFCCAKAIMNVWKPKLANTVDNSSSLSKKLAASVLNHAVIEASQGEIHLKSLMGLTTNVTPKLLKHLCENVIIMTLSLESESLPVSRLIGVIENKNKLAKLVEIQKPTDTMTTMTNPILLDGFAVVAILDTMPKSMEVGEKDLNKNRLFYCAKSSKAERNAGLEEGVTNTHETVKPLALMRYLCRLITPPNGLILDPFAGSGSTLIAAREENFKAIGVELEEDYCQIAVGRLSQVQPNLFNVGD